MPFSSSSVYRYNPRQKREHEAIENSKTTLMTTGRPVSPIKTSGELAATVQGTTDPNIGRKTIEIGKPWHNAPNKGSCQSCGFANRPESVYQKRYDREGHVHASHSGVIRQDYVRMALAHKVAAGEIPGETAKALESSHYRFDKGFRSQHKHGKPEEVEKYETAKLNNSVGFGSNTERRLTRTLYQQQARPLSQFSTATQLLAHSRRKETNKNNDDDEEDVYDDKMWDGVEDLKYVPSGMSALHYRTGEFKPLHPPLHHNRKFTMTTWEDEKRETQRKREEGIQIRKTLPETKSGSKVSGNKWREQTGKIREDAKRAQELRKHQFAN